MLLTSLTLRLPSFMYIQLQYINIAKFTKPFANSFYEYSYYVQQPHKCSLWHKSIGAAPVSDISSDRTCAIRFSVNEGDRSVVSVIGVYMPCLDQGIDCFGQHMAELESRK